MKRGFTCDLRKKKDHKWKPFTQGEGKSAPWEKKKKESHGSVEKGRLQEWWHSKYKTQKLQFYQMYIFILKEYFSTNFFLF